MTLIMMLSVIITIQADDVTLYYKCNQGSDIYQQLEIYSFFLNWDSLYARQNNRYEAWSYRKKKYKKTKVRLEKNPFRKNLQLKGIC